MSVDLARIQPLIADLLRPGRFFVREDLKLSWAAPAPEEVSWEVFRGRLLDPAHTRKTSRFLSWSIFQGEGEQRSPEPLISVKFDVESGTVHVVRAIHTHVWTGFDAGGNVIESRETTRWVRELVGTIALAAFGSTEEVRQELSTLIGAALEGTSRLPLTSVEAPLPAFALGQLAYLPDRRAADACPVSTTRGLVELPRPPLEILLRALSSGEVRCVAQQLGGVANLPNLLRAMFLKVSLSPYTDFVPNTLALVQALVEQGRIDVAAEVDLWSWLLRQLGRHLTAYDLVTFHHRGANYPDALLLDQVLQRFLHLVETKPELVQVEGPAGEQSMRRLRRRALRQACLLRRHYEGHPVPDVPTSPGENARVMPPPHQRVPEEQLLHVLRRRKRLYAEAPLAGLIGSAARALLRESILDLADAREWRELGCALFVDRPLGWGKAVGEPDLTPLLAHEAYSPSIAQRRETELGRLATELGIRDVQPACGDAEVSGLSASLVAEPDRPIVSLADARRVAPDFVVLRTMPRGLKEAWQRLDLPALRAAGLLFAEARDVRLAVRLPAEAGTSVVALFDHDLHKRQDLITDLSRGFVLRGGIEMPALLGVRG